VAYSQQITVGEGENIELEGSLRSNETVNYQLQGQQGQNLRVQLSGEGVLLTVLAPNGNPADGQASRVLGWTGPLEFTGQYVIQLSPVEGLTDSNYKLTVAVEGAETPTPVETPAPTETPAPPEEPPVEPSISEQRVRIPQGQDSLLVANGVGPGQIQRYVINLREGQVLSANIESASGPALLADDACPVAKSCQARPRYGLGKGRCPWGAITPLRLAPSKRLNSPSILGRGINGRNHGHPRCQWIADYWHRHGCG
jgi:hypothetical protein